MHSLIYASFFNIIISLIKFFFIFTQTGVVTIN
jgi:hypothetical protein